MAEGTDIPSSGAEQLQAPTLEAESEGESSSSDSTDQLCTKVTSADCRDRQSLQQ